MSVENDQPTAREILDAVLHSQDVLTTALRRIEADVAMLKGELAIVKTDVKALGESLYRLERRVIRIDDRLSVIEDLRLRSMLDDHERASRVSKGSERKAAAVDMNVDRYKSRPRRSR